MASDAHPAPRPVHRHGIAVIGAGQHARVVASTIEAAGLELAGFYDDSPETWGRAIAGSAVLGSPHEIPSGAPAVLAIGDNAARKRIAANLDLDWTAIVHPFAWIDPGTTVGPGTVVCSGVTVQIGASIGAHVILNNGASVGHDAHVSDYAHLVVTHLGSSARAGEGALLGIGSVVLPDVRIGAWSTVGAGAVATTDVAPGATVIGNPARPLARQEEVTTDGSRDPGQ